MKDKKLYFGIAYYPESWPGQSIEDELDKMLSMDFNLIRVGEFAWSTMEPKKGQYDLSLFRRVVDVAKEKNMDVVMCTPTPCPPAWMVEEDKDVLFTNQAGRKVVHGARRLTCFSNELFIERSKKITEVLAKEFANDTNIVGWQIDNELIIGDNWGGCRCPKCVSRYHKYLEERYQTIENLNKEWNTYVWSIEFQKFSQIEPPNRDIWNHPAVISTWGEFQNQIYNEFIAMQVDIIKKYSNALVSTDQVPLLGLSYDDVARNVDLIQYNHYNDEKTMWRLACWCDYIRNFKEHPFWITETAPNWNGSEFANYSRPKNFVLANSMLSIQLGAEMNAYWLWRSHLGGHELMHGSVVDSYGREMHNIEEIKKIGRDLKTLSPYLTSTRLVQNKVAATFTHISDSILSAQSIVPEFKYQDSIENFIYKPFCDRHVRLDLIGASKTLEDYEVLISPFTVTLDEHNLAEKIHDFVIKGGRWIVLPLTDLRTTSGRKYAESPFGYITKWTGVDLMHLFPKGEIYDVEFADGKTIKPMDLVYYDLECGEEDEVLAKFTSGYLEGKPAIIKTKMGQGEVIVFGFVPQEEDMVDLLLPYLPEMRNEKASENILVSYREGEYDIFQAQEIGNQAGDVVIPFDGYNVLTKEQYHRNQKVELRPYEYLFVVKK